MRCVSRFSASRRLHFGARLIRATAPLAALFTALLFADPAAAQCAPSSPCATQPENLGALGGAGSSSFAFAISGDGTTVVGGNSSPGPGGGTSHAFRWTSAGMTDIHTLGLRSSASAVNGDGTVIVGGYFTSNMTNPRPLAYRWTSATGMVALGTMPGDNASIANGVSGDGSIVVGASQFFGGGGGGTLQSERAFSWTELGGMVALTNLAGTLSSSAAAANIDASVIVGFNQNASERHAVKWTTSGVVDLGTLPGGTGSQALGVNSSGSAIVGTGNGAGFSGSHAVLWTDGGMTDLGGLGGDFADARDVSSDGRVVVGFARNATSFILPFRWTAVTGLVDLNVLLANAGVDMTNINLVLAWGISDDGKLIVGQGTFSGATRAYLVRYDDGDIAGLTTADSLLGSVNALADDRFGMMAHQHGLANPLLGGDKPMSNDSEAGVFGMGGSAAGGGFARYASGGGIAILAGVSYGEEAYQDASIEDSLMGALAVRYLAPGAAPWRPFAEAGGWIAPEPDLEFERTYMNGAGTATGIGNTEGDVSYYYARAGVVFDLGKREQVVVSGEIGRERLEVDGYAETLSATNPFNAQVSSGTDEMDLAKARLAWSFALAPRFDATLWGAGVYVFNRETDLVTSVAGLGVFAPVVGDDTAWAEYGARVGYSVTEQVTFDVFVNGVSGDDDIGTRVHGGGGLRYRF